jgi:hypothetical protein
LSLNNLFLALPGWGLGVKVPISMKPNPKSLSSLYNLASLSNPAASPTGLLNFNPKTSRSMFLLSSE